MAWSRSWYALGFLLNLHGRRSCVLKASAYETAYVHPIIVFAGREPHQLAHEIREPGRVAGDIDVAHCGSRLKCSRPDYLVAYGRQPL